VYAVSNQLVMYVETNILFVFWGTTTNIHSLLVQANMFVDFGCVDKQSHMTLVCKLISNRKLVCVGTKMQ